MRLQKIFLFLALLLTALVLVQMLHTLSVAVIKLREGANGLEAMNQLRLVLVASEMASRERGPANGVLGDALPHEPKNLALLSAARKKTDAAFTDLKTSVESFSDDQSGLPTILLTAQKQLLRARQLVDSTADLQRGQRTPEQIRTAIAHMFEVIELLSPVSLQLTNVVQASYPKETNLLLAARSAADLREFAGRLGSHFTLALTKREHIEMAELTAIEQLIGRIEQLRVGILERLPAEAGNEVVERATTLMLSHYFDTAIPFVREQLVIGLGNANFAIDAAGFARRYVPDMDAIIFLRDTLINEALRKARIERAEAQTAAYLSIFWMVASLLLVAAILLILEFRIGRPLRKTVQLILDIAHGKLEMAIPKQQYQDEMAEVLDAIAVLRDNSLARAALESERQGLLVKLKEQASTDFLTGLPNRRGFFDLVEPTFHSLRRQGHPISIAIFDIDHFKRVNDVYGHDMGDRVLKEIGNLSMTQLRSGDVVARLGGEEFLLFMPYCGVEAGFNKVEQLRKQIEQFAIALPNGEELAVTASFGVDQCLATDESIHHSIKRCDEKLYLAKGSGRNKVV